MITYIVAAIVGGILASLVLLAAHWASQQREQLARVQDTITEQLDAIRQDNAQGRARVDSVAESLRETRQDLHGLLLARVDSERIAATLEAAKQAVAKLAAAADKLDEAGKKLDDLAEGGEAGTGFALRRGPLIRGLKPSPTAAPIVRNFEFGTPGVEADFGVPEPVERWTKTPSIKFGRVASQPAEPAEPFEPLPQAEPAAPKIHIEGYHGPLTFPFPAEAPAAPATTAAPAPAPIAIITKSPDRRVVDIMFATTRAYDDAQERFTGERAKALTFGQAFVRIPEAHSLGEVERPQEHTFLSFTIYKEKEDPKKHFVLRGINILPKERWIEFIRAMPEDDALVFVHGFNNSFEDALFRNAQILYDLKYRGIAVLFSWPSRGAIADYVYDKESALGARKPFIEVLQLLTAMPNVKRVHILAHSMGNLVVLDALANHQAGAVPLNIGELMMAAPDVDRDHYVSIAEDVRKLTKGMTLYASSADKALLASKFVAGNIPRAGDVPDGGPIVLPRIDSIDATSVGNEIFGLNHANFAHSRSILNDVHLVMSGLRPPDKRLVEILARPEGVDPPHYWQYAPE